MNKNLLNITTRSFLIFSVIVLIISAPLFYFVTEKLYSNQADEALMLRKAEFLDFSKNGFTTADIAVWNKYNSVSEIVPSKGIVKDTIVDSMHYNAGENEFEPYRQLWVPITIDGVKYTFVDRANTVEREDIVLITALLFLLIIGVLLVGIIWISNRSSVKIWRPFYDTLGQIRDFEIDKSRHPEFVPTDIEEFDSLNQSIRRLIAKNMDIYRNQKEFIENAAHELQTPLALFQAKIDTLFQSAALSEEQSEILDSLNNDVSRMNRLNKNLLLLSKIENENMVDKQPFVLDEYINRQLDFFSEQAEPRNVAIVTQFDKKLKIESYPGMAEVLVNNLFLNAIRHNRNGGKIMIDIAGRTLAFRNTGQDNALLADKLFNRFSKSDPSSKGNGLGLAIIKKIADLNGWEISYAFENNLHGFTVKF